VTSPDHRRWGTTSGVLNASDPSGGLRSRRGVPAGHRNQLSASDHAQTGASPLPFHCPVDGGTSYAEQVGEFSGAVVPAVEQSHQVRFLPVVQLGLLTRKRPLALATFMPSRVRSRMRSVSATIARTLNSNRPTGSVGSYTDPPRFRRT
jgi:hypothetical protein